LAVTDKSSPEEIYLQFGMSKKAFKKTLGALFKQKKMDLPGLLCIKSTRFLFFDK
jgi:predicted RNA-binding protein (virulence factor B family)